MVVLSYRCAFSSLERGHLSDLASRPHGPVDLRSIEDFGSTQEEGVVLNVLGQAIGTSTSEGMLMLSLLGAFAQFENDIRAERQIDGIAKAKEKGGNLR